MWPGRSATAFPAKWIPWICNEKPREAAASRVYFLHLHSAVILRIAKRFEMIMNTSGNHTIAYVKRSRRIYAPAKLHCRYSVRRSFGSLCSLRMTAAFILLLHPPNSVVILSGVKRSRRIFAPAILRCRYSVRRSFDSLCSLRMTSTCSVRKVRLMSIPHPHQKTPGNPPLAPLSMG